MHIPIVGRATLKIFLREIKWQFVKQERNTQIAIALLNYLKRMAPQQSMRRTEFFTKKIFKRKNRNRNCINKILHSRANSYHRDIRTWVFRISSAGLNHYAMRASLNNFFHSKSTHKVQRALLRFWKPKFALRRNKKSLRTYAFQRNMPNSAHSKFLLAYICYQCVPNWQQLVSIWLLYACLAM
jgi:hypothetical protein